MIKFWVKWQGNKCVESNLPGGQSVPGARCADRRRLLAELYIERKGGERLVGKCLQGQGQNVLPGMQAAFVDIGLERNAFLYAGDINFDEADFHSWQERKRRSTPARYPPAGAGWGRKSWCRSSRSRLVPRGAHYHQYHVAGPLAGADAHGGLVGVSRRIEDEEKRMEMRALLEEIRPPHIGLIARTVSFGMTREDLRHNSGSR